MQIKDDEIHYICIRMAQPKKKKKRKIQHVGEDAEQLELMYCWWE